MSVLDDELDVEKALHRQRVRDAAREQNDLVALGGEQILRGIDRVAVAGMDAGALDVLHDSGDERLASVGDRIDLDLLTAEVFVDEHAARAGLERRAEIPLEVLRSVGDLHATAAQYVAWANEHGVADLRRDRERLRWWRRGAARRLRDAERARE